MKGAPPLPENRVVEIVFEITGTQKLSSTDLASFARFVNYIAQDLLVEESQVLLDILALAQRESVDFLAYLSNLAKRIPAPLTLSAVERGSWHFVMQFDSVEIVRFVQQSIQPVVANILMVPELRDRIMLYLAERAFGDVSRRIREYVARKRKVGNVRAVDVTDEPPTSPTQPRTRVRFEPSGVVEAEGFSGADVRRMMTDFWRTRNQP